MTRYHGGKAREGKELAKLISEYASSTGKAYNGYCEPFCGMLGIYRHIPDFIDVPNYKAGDANESVIAMWKAVQKGYKLPTSCTEKRYNELKNMKKPHPDKGFCGHEFAFGGQYLGGFRKDEKLNKDRSVIVNRIEEIAKKLKKCKFTAGPYTQFSGLKNYIIYCDPPYANTWCKYSDENRKVRKFDNAAFWEWCKEMSKDNLMIVSEYSAPKGWRKIYKNYVHVNANPKCKAKMDKADCLFVRTDVPTSRSVKKVDKLTIKSKVTKKSSDTKSNDKKKSKTTKSKAKSSSTSKSKTKKTTKTAKSKAMKKTKTTKKSTSSKSKATKSKTLRIPKKYIVTNEGVEYVFMPKDVFIKFVH